MLCEVVPAMNRVGNFRKERYRVLLYRSQDPVNYTVRSQSLADIENPDGL
jgi:hypothetical protein